MRRVSMAFLGLAVAAGVFAATARPHAVARAACKPAIAQGVVHYCGPATARLSLFGGVTFRNGTCKRQTVGGAPLLSLGVGALSRNAATNKGLPYFGLTVSGPLSKPTGGGVIVYYKSKRWGGRGISFKATTSGGTFVVKGIGGSKGTASGSFHC